MSGILDAAVSEQLFAQEQNQKQLQRMQAIEEEADPALYPEKLRADPLLAAEMNAHFADSLERARQENRASADMSGDEFTVKLLSDLYANEVVAQRQNHLKEAAPKGVLMSSDADPMFKEEVKALFEDQIRQTRDANLAWGNQAVKVQDAYRPSSYKPPEVKLRDPVFKNEIAENDQEGFGPTDALLEGISGFRAAWLNQLQIIKKYMPLLDSKEVSQAVLIRVQTSVSMMNLNATIFQKTETSFIDSLRQLLSAQ